MFRLDWLTFGAMILLMGLVLAEEEKEREAHAEYYCEMVELHEESKGEYGWPNYDNREC